jgi:hypothetical protein
MRQCATSPPRLRLFWAVGARLPALHKSGLCKLLDRSVVPVQLGKNREAMPLLADCCVAPLVCSEKPS